MTRLVEDRALCEAFRRGERGALGEVYQEYAAAVFALLRRGFEFESAGRRIRFAGFAEHAEVENLVQEVFVRAFGEPARLAYDGLRPYRNYLFTIARNLVSDIYRKKSRVFVEIDEVEGHETATTLTAAAPEQQVQDQQIEAHVHNFMAHLSKEERAVFDVRFREGLSIEEAAARLRVSEHEVKSTTHRLRKRFFHFMRRHGYFDAYRWQGQGLSRADVGVLCGVALLRLGGLS